MLGKLGNRLLDELPKVTLAVQVVRSRRRILELEWTLFVLQLLLMVWNSTSGFRDRFRSSFFARFEAIV